MKKAVFGLFDKPKSCFYWLISQYQTQPDNLVERETGFEPATSTLARLHSTTELLPREQKQNIQSSFFCQGKTTIFYKKNLGFKNLQTGKNLPSPQNHVPRGIALVASLGYYTDMQNSSLIHRPRLSADVPLAARIDTISSWLGEHKAEDIVCIDIAGKGAFADALLVLTAHSVRHAQSLADGVAELCHEHNYEYLRVEGRTAGQWILVDLNDLVVNIFLAPVRELYRLETLWDTART